MDVTILTESPVGIALHYIDALANGQGKSRPCMLPDPCGFCGHSLRDGWAGYLGADSHWAKELVMMPFTLDAWRELCERLIGDEPVRGTRWTMTRGKGRVNGPWMMKREKQTIHQRDLKDAPDLMPSLRAMYGDIAQLRSKSVGLSDEMGGIS